MNNPNSQPVRSRKDDAFMRRMLWLLLGVAISSSGGWIWTIAVLQTEVNHIAGKTQRYDESVDTLIEMKVLIKILVANSNERNALLKDVVKQQTYIFGEQKRRLPIIKDTQRHIRDRSIHK